MGRGLGRHVGLPCHHLMIILTECLSLMLSVHHISIFQIFQTPKYNNIFVNMAVGGRALSPMGKIWYNHLLLFEHDFNGIKGPFVQ